MAVEGGRVVAVGDGEPPRPADLALDLVVPGFVDTHVHGGGGASFDDGPVATVLETHLRHGTTTVVASLVTASLASMEQSVAGLAGLPVHLEGPWLSPARAGAHDPALLRDPTPQDVERLLAAGDVRMVTLAPELPGALAATAQLVEAGVVVAIGHTDATYDQTRAALDAGATVGTHLFNAMPPLHHRDPGPVGALLASSAYVELVADGVHVHPAVLAAAWREGRTTLVTDAMAAAGAFDGSYRLGALEVTVREGVARLGSGAIAGSTATLDASLRTAVAAGVPLASALAAVTSTPAAALGLPDVGVLAPGAHADLVALSADLEVQRVMKAGAWLA